MKEEEEEEEEGEEGEEEEEGRQADLPRPCCTSAVTSTSTLPSAATTAPRTSASSVIPYMERVTPVTGGPFSRH